MPPINYYCYYCHHLLNQPPAISPSCKNQPYLPPDTRIIYPNRLVGVAGAYGY